MIFLLGSIVLTSFLTLAFTVVGRYRISNLQVIVVNHAVCVVTGSLLTGHFPITQYSKPWFLWALVMGFFFISLFNVIAFTAQRSGVAVASVANKLSLVVPFMFSLYLYNEPATWMKIIGVIVALTAVVLTCLPPRQSAVPGKVNMYTFALPAILFLGSGILDTMIKYVEQRFLDHSSSNDFLITAFGAAAFFGLILLIILFVMGKEKFDHRSLVAGFLIGVPNYFSIWCLLRVLKTYPTNSSAIIPINNMGIVLFSTIVAWLLFKEKLSLINWMGVALSLASISLIAFG